MNDKNSCSEAAQAKHSSLASQHQASQPWQHCALPPPRRGRRRLMRWQRRRSRQLIRWRTFGIWRWTRSRSSCQWSLGPAGARPPTWVRALRAPQVQVQRSQVQRSRRHLRRGAAGEPAQGPEAQGDADCRFIQEMNTMGIVAISAFAKSALGPEAGTAHDVKAG
jgi:hypothetical protein